MPRPSLIPLCLLVGCFSEPPPPNQTTDGSSGSGSATVGSTSDVTTTDPTGDDSTTAGSGVDTTADSTGEPPVGCGNGIVDGDGEQCDDGNDVPTDGCHQCLSSGSVLWESFDGNASDQESVFGLAVDSTGNVYAVGTIGAGAGTEAWLRKFQPDGTVEWTRNPLPSATGNADGLFGIYLESDDAILVVGHEFVMGQSYDRVVIRYDASGATQFIEVEDFVRASSQPNGAVSIVVDVDGQLLTSGYRFQSLLDSDAVVEQHTPAGVSTGVAHVAGNAVGEIVSAGWLLARRDAWVRAALFLDDRVEVAAWDGGFGDGTPVWSTVLPGTVAAGLPLSEVFEPIPVAIESDGSTVVCNNVDAGGGAQDIQLARLDVDGQPLSTDTLDNGGTTDRCGGLAVAANGDLLLAWSADVDDANGTFMVTRLSPGGEEQWQVALPVPAAGLARGVAIAEDPEGFIVVGGALNQRVGDRDLYVAKLVP